MSTAHLGIKPYQCELCKYEFALSYRLRRHMQSHFRCLICDSKPFLETRENFEKHNAELHPDYTIAYNPPKRCQESKRIKNHLCHLCPFKCDRPGRLDKHLVTVHNEEPNPTLNKVNCSEGSRERKISGDNSSSEGPRKNKRRVQPKPFECQVCPRKYRKQELLDAHLSKRHTSNIKYDCNKFHCNQCSSKFRKKHQLDRHFYVKHANKDDFIRPLRLRKRKALRASVRLSKRIRKFRIPPTIKEICEKNQVEVDKKLRIRLKRIDPNNILEALENDQKESEEMVDIKPSLEEFIQYDPIDELISTQSCDSSEMCEVKKITADLD